MHFLEHLPGNLALQGFDFFGSGEAVSVAQRFTQHIEHPDARHQIGYVQRVEMLTTGQTLLGH